MEGYHLRSRSVLPDTRVPEEVFPPQSSESFHPLEGPVEGLVPEGRSQVSAEQPGAMELEAISGQSGTALSAPIANLPHEVQDVSALEDLGEDPDPEAEVAANAGVPSPPVLDVVAVANVGETIA